MMMYHASNGCGAAVQVDAIFENGRLVDVFRDGMAPTVDKPVIVDCPECGKRLYLADLLTPSEYADLIVGSTSTAWAAMQIREAMK